MKRISTGSERRARWDLIVVVVAVPVLAYGIARSDLTLVGVVGVLAVPLLLTSPTLCLGLALASTGLQTLMPTLPAGVTVTDLLLALFLASYLLDVLRFDRYRPVPRWTLWLLGFLAWAWLSLFMSLLDNPDGATALARITLYGVVMFAATQVGSARKVLLAALAVAAAQVVLIIVGVAPTQRPGRPEGLVGDVQSLGILLLLALPCARLVRHIVWRSVLTAVLVIGMALTFTRSIWAAGLAQIAMMVAPAGIRKRRSLTLSVLVLVVLIAVAVQGDATRIFRLDRFSLPLRQQSWGLGLANVRERPIFGQGWAYPTSTGETRPFNTWLNTAASVGIPGMVMLMLFFGNLFLFLHRRRFQNEVANAVFVYLSGFVVVSLVEMLLYAGAPTTVTLFIIVGLAIGEPVTSERSLWQREDGQEPMPRLHESGSKGGASRR